MLASMDVHMTMRFDGQVAVVTGAASGIGKAIARLFARQGATVVMFDRQREQGLQAMAEITAAGGQAHFLTVDVTQPVQVEQAMAQVMAQWGRMDVLVNNAGINPSALIWEMPLEMWYEVININLTGCFLCARFAAAHMLDRGGSIVNVSSVLGEATLPGQAAYSASKAGIIGLTKALAIDLAPKQVRVNCILPGSTDTPLMWGYRDKAEVPLDVQQRAAADVPLGRVASPEEIAPAVLFLASPAAALITGACLTVDGGLLAKIGASI
jgi:NAD(P)-dependent dehydrogenase (short-subunit alcohol dehydrogenase family)